MRSLIVFNFMFPVEETLIYGDNGITTSMHNTRKPPEIVQINLNIILQEVVTIDKSW
jgi:hypothetical protein